MMPRTVTLTLLAGCLALGLAAPANAGGVPVVAPAAETPALFDDEAGGNANADDPAIWVHPGDPARSLVLGTAKEGGLHVYGLDGRVVQHVAAPPAPGEGDENGRFNNVDLLPGRDLAVVTDRGRGTLRFYRVSGSGVTDVTDPAAPLLFDRTQEEVNEQRTPYGLAVFTRGGRSYAVVSRRSTSTLALVELVRTRAGYTYRTVRTIALPTAFRLPDGTSWTPCGEPGEEPQVEGMVVDARTGTLYAAQEAVGIWRVPATLGGRPELVDRVREFGVPGTYDPETEECEPGADPGFGGTRLAADAEGLTIYYGRGGAGYLIASGQGDDTFVVYDRRDGRYLRSFKVGAGNGVDGAQHSDGAAVLGGDLGPAFPRGLLVVHDGENTPADGSRENTNFKFVRWDAVARPLGLTH